MSPRMVMLLVKNELKVCGRSRHNSVKATVASFTWRTNGNHENLSWDTRSPERNLNLGPP
jgi:hypothetical protein